LRFPHQRVAITGAASGLGRALALVFAGRGWRVACLDVNEAGLTETAKLVTAAGGQAIGAVLDVRSDADFARVADQIHAAWGGLDVLVNNAGIASMGEFAGASMAEWQRVMDVNLMGVVRGVHTFARWMTEAKSGHIVNIASVAGLASAPGMASYGVSKAAVVALSEQLRAEMAPHGVGVTLVCPSFFATNLLASMDASEKAKARISRWMEKSEHTADDIARMIADATETNQFMLIPHKKAVTAWRTKRWLPEYYFRKLKNMMPR
jgi:NAD(P)-dependent dehydrogenase (short-subunit alcohol dehydrogenase family)